MYYHRWQFLIDALNGLPNERKATATIATFTVIPTACAGIVAGGFLAPDHRDLGLLVGGLIGGGAAVAVALGGVYLAYWLFGFRGVVRVGEALLGLLAGALLGSTLGGLFDLGWWPLLLAPAFAVLNAVFRPFARKPKAEPPEAPSQPGEWRRKHQD
ncbi:MAG: hypothetical protein ACOVT5_14185 [Armatimonadaceae bacterium]